MIARNVRRSLALVALLLPVLGASAGATAVPQKTFAPATVKAIDGAVAKWFKDYKAPGVIVGIWFPRRGAYVKAAGTSDPSTGAPMRLGEHMRIASITKTFTVTILLQLADRKRLSLDDTVSKYVSGIPNGGHITLRMLANMTSGLFNYTEDPAFTAAMESNPHRVWSDEELVAWALKPGHKPYFAPGKGFHYSNTNTVLLGEVIKKVLSASELGEIYRKYSFAPLNLTQTSWPGVSSSLPQPFARGITLVNGKIVDATTWSPTQAGAAGEIVSTLSDLRTWTKALATGAQISTGLQKQRLDWVQLPPNTPKDTYGLGISNDNGWLGHNGSIRGYNSQAMYLPSQDATIVVLINSDITKDKRPPVTALFHDITAILTPNNVTF